MAEGLMTLAQIEEHLDKANIEQYNQPTAKAAGAQGAAGASGNTLEKICGVYKAIRPILEVVAKFPILPERIRGAIKTFMTVLDAAEQ